MFTSLAYATAVPPRGISKFFFAAFGGREKREKAGTPRTPQGDCSPLDPCFMALMAHEMRRNCIEHLTGSLSVCYSLFYQAVSPLFSSTARCRQALKQITY